MYIGSWPLDGSVPLTCQTHGYAGSAIDADSLPTYRVYEQVTATPIATGTMALFDDANTTGFYVGTLTLGTVTGYEQGKGYTVRIQATVGSVPAVTERFFQVLAPVDAYTISGTLVNIGTAAVSSIQSGLAGTASLGSVAAVAVKLDTGLELDGAVYRWTSNALEQAPAFGAGGLGLAASSSAYTYWTEAPFGDGYGTLGTAVGYQLINETGSTLTARTNTGVVELDSDSGLYGAWVTIPAGMSAGAIVWDTGGAAPEYAVEAIGSNSDAVRSIIASLASEGVSVTVLTAVSGGTITITRGDTFAGTVTGLGSLAGRTKLYWTVKGDKQDDDALAIVQVTEQSGLLRLNAATGTAVYGTITVSDETAGDVVLSLSAAATAALAEQYKMYFDIQVVTATGVSTRTSGVCHVAADVTRAVS